MVEKEKREPAQGAALASSDQMFPETGPRWAKLTGLAPISLAGGRGLIAYALAHLRASFSSLRLPLASMERILPA